MNPSVHTWWLVNHPHCMDRCPHCGYLYDGRNPQHGDICTWCYESDLRRRCMKDCAVCGEKLETWQQFGDPIHPVCWHCYQMQQSGGQYRLPEPRVKELFDVIAEDHKLTDYE